MSVLDETWHETRARLRETLGRTHALADSADNTRTLLRLALNDRWGARRGEHAWLRDFGDDWVVFEHSYRDASDRHQEDTVKVGYSVSNGVVTFTGQLERVRERIEYVSRDTPEQARAFQLEVTDDAGNGHTVITGPAAAFLEKASSPNPMFLNIMGRFVGAEKANRNKALWTTDDLVFGQPTVKNGPLNWLHEERHIVGAISEAALLTPETAEDGDTEPPYIAASASMWKWLWPNESAVVEMAAAAGNLWYSMECISDTVVCYGDEGCGTEVAYLDAVRKSEKCCEHLIERSAERRFKQPTFLGGAVIVPPVRPGWDKANATVLSEAARYSERAYEQAGQPDVSSSDWDRLMAQVLTYAKG